MLVLTRRPGEQIIIGDGITISVVSIGPGRVKIGIQAPANVRVDRQEIHDRMAAEPKSIVASTVVKSVSVEAMDPLIVINADSEGDANAPRLHNRISDKLPPLGTVNPPSPSSNRIVKNRLPRKSR